MEAAGVFPFCSCKPCRTGRTARRGFVFGPLQKKMARADARAGAQTSAIRAEGSDMVLHGVGQVAMGVQLVTGDIARRCIEQRGDAVDDGGAGVLHGGGLHHMELRIRLAGQLPVAHIAIVRAVDLANGLLLHGDALHGLDGDHGRHTDAVPAGMVRPSVALYTS